jgi:RNA polymerase sigma factor (sigma-70 family)
MVHQHAYRELVQGVSGHRPEASGKQLVSRVDQALARLSKLEREILRWRYGLSGPPLSLKQVARKLALRKSKVRETEARALRSLRYRNRRKGDPLKEV